jgi:hypothetical protein
MFDRINDGVFSDFAVSEQAPISRYSVENNKYLKFNATFLAHLNSSSHSCGYETLMEAVKYPQPVGPIFLPNASAPGCDLFTDFNNAAMEANPCFNIYRITDVCPNPVDIITDGSYFSRPDVQAALHVPNSGAWLECSNDYPFVNQTDVSPFTETLLPAILAKIPVLLWHGNVDASQSPSLSSHHLLTIDPVVLLTAGDLITIQNMTWGGQQGFQTAPTSPLLINGKASGVYHTERSLSFVSVDGAGHMIPQDNPPVRTVPLLSLSILNVSNETGRSSHLQIVPPDWSSRKWDFQRIFRPYSHQRNHLVTYEREWHFHHPFFRNYQRDERNRSDRCECWIRSTPSLIALNIHPVLVGFLAYYPRL